jgi:ABC-type multidrug transport system fused ATPase/permease subunit
MKSLKLIYYLFFKLKQNRIRQLFILLILMISASFMEVISIGLVVPFLKILASPETALNLEWLSSILSYFNFHQSNELVYFITIIFICSTILAGGMRLTLLFFQTRLGHGIGADLSLDIYEKMLYQPYEVHIASSSGDILSALTNKVNMIVNQTIIPLLVLISSFFIILGICGVLFLVDPFITFSVIFIFSLIYFFLVFFSRPILNASSIVVNDNSNKIIKIIQEGLWGIRDILIDGTQEIYSNIFKNIDRPLRRASANIQIVSGAPRFILESFALVLIASFAFFETRSSNGLESSIPILGVFALAAQRLLPVLQQSYASWSSFKGGESSLIETMKLLDYEIDNHNDFVDVQPLVFKRNISFNKVCFSFSGDKPNVLVDLSFEIKKGTCVGFFGSTGSGKSTLLDVLMGLLTPSSGQFCVDDVIVTPKNVKHWQIRLAHVPQSIFLKDSSIAENIAFSVDPEKINMDRLKEVAIQAQLMDTINLLPEKFETIVGERGVRLSGGQRQRIGIARALYKNADVLIFDEATSALDNKTENSFMNALESFRLDNTIIIVAHRLTTLKNCDVVYEIENGKILNKGSYIELISKQIS